MTHVASVIPVSVLVSLLAGALLRLDINEHVCPYWLEHVLIGCSMLPPLSRIYGTGRADIGDQLSPCQYMLWPRLCRLPPCSRLPPFLPSLSAPAVAATAQHPSIE